MSDTLFSFAHLSDLHYFSPIFMPERLFSKRILGFGNVLLRRYWEFDYRLAEATIETLQREKVSFVLISGDVSCLATKREFAKAKQFVSRLQALGIETIVLPGNHDKYTEESERNRTFYTFFPSSLSESGLLVRSLTKDCYLIALDTALPTGWFQCHGSFSKSLEKALEETITSLPKQAKVIIANHFPLVSEKGETLLRKEALQSLCKRLGSQILLYLHGHTHTPSIRDLRKEGLPVIMDAGSCVVKEKGGWSLVSGTKEGISLRSFTPKGKKWKPGETFFLPSEDRS